MLMIIGLGNPGLKYENTRHNAGFKAIDLLAKKWAVSLEFHPKFNAEIGKYSHESNETIILVKPHTFMNNSGEAVQKIAHFYKISTENCWVVFDELDLPLGKIKILKNGGAGTHNGMKSIVQMIGKDFPRFRLGIESRGATSPAQQDTHSFVLETFNEEEKEIFEKILQKAVEAIKLALEKDLETAMNKFNI